MTYPDYEPGEHTEPAMLRYVKEGHSGPGVYVYSPVFGWTLTGLADERQEKSVEDENPSRG
jgi:hypothetical protein